MALRNDSPTGSGGRGRSPKSLSFSGKNHDGTCLSLARSGRPSSPFHVADSSRFAAAGTLCAAGLGAGLAATIGGWIASGSPPRRFGSALEPGSDVCVRRAAVTGAGFAGFGAEALDATPARSGCVSLSLCVMATTRDSRAALSIVAGEIWTTAVAGPPLDLPQEIGAERARQPCPRHLDEFHREPRHEGEFHGAPPDFKRLIDFQTFV
jgi:hypothetical protein